MYQVEVFIRSRRAILGPFFFAVLFAVMQLSAFATGSVTLAWNASTDSSVAGYNVYYGGASGAYTNKICAGDATNATISGLVEGTTYYFAATTYASSSMESPFSSEVSYLVPMNVPIVNQPPTLNAINNLTINENAGLQTVSLSGITSGATNENQRLTVTAASTNTGLIPNPTVNYTNANATGNLTFRPVVNKTGTATFTVTVKEGGTSNIVTRTRTFTVTVASTIGRTGRGHLSFSKPLTNSVALVGQTKTLSVTATGTGALRYQWQFNGTNLPSAVSPVLTLSKVTTNQAGTYSVMVYNSTGSTTSTAKLTVYATAAAILSSTAHAAGQYALIVAGVPGYNYVVQASTNLINWVPVQTNTAPFTFVDTNASRFGQRFYRSVYAP
jgi:hypothetical protein